VAFVLELFLNRFRQIQQTKKVRQELEKLVVEMSEMLNDCIRREKALKGVANNEEDTATEVHAHEDQAASQPSDKRKSQRCFEHRLSNN